MSKQSEKLISIILPDLLNYLEMVESGEIIERRIEKNKLLNQKNEKHITITNVNQKATKDR